MNISLKRAALAALVLESMMLSAFAFIPDSQPVPKQVEMISLATVPEPEKDTPKPPRKEPVHKAEHKTVSKALTRQVATREPQPVQSAPEPMPDKTPPVAATREKAEPVQEKPSPEITPSFKDEVRAAVQAAVVYPMAARMAHVTGRARVAFFYLDGMPSDARIIVSSGNGLLDRAALAAVMAASYPRPAPEFAGKKLQFELWVRFHGVEE